VPLSEFCPRAFSSVEKLITPERNAPADATIEATELSKGLVEQRSTPSRQRVAVTSRASTAPIPYWPITFNTVLYLYTTNIFSSRVIPFSLQLSFFLIRKVLTPGLPNRPTTQARTSLGLCCTAGAEHYLQRTSTCQYDRDR
jgi:hypothetical protein